jgi:uncharacterized OB-fold protein
MSDEQAASDTAVSAPFWDAAGRGELVIQRCGSCERLVWYPRALCPRCGGAELRWEPVSGDGTVYAVSVHHRAPTRELSNAVPYAVVLVDLDAGPRLMARAAGGAADDVTVGQRVRWRPDPDGGKAFVFEPISRG